MKRTNCFLEIIAALGLKVALKIQLNELMKLSKCQKSRPSFDLGQTSLRFQSKKTLFFAATVGRFGTKAHMKN